MTAPGAGRSAPTLRDTVRAAEARLSAAGVDSPGLDARLLVMHALGLTRERLLIQATARLSPAQADRVTAFIDRRVAREPVSRIIGRREFWSLDFAITSATLDPRPDSETVISAALDIVGDRHAPLRLLDLGTGTGCLLLALLSELREAAGLGVDRDAGAVETAAANARALGLDRRARFAVGDWGMGLTERFDLVVSNPPYIPDGDIEGLEPEVSRFEPRGALAGGADGLDAYRRIAGHLGGLLEAQGHAVFEVGAGQAEPVAAILEQSGFAVVRIVRDLAGIERCVCVRPR